MLATLEFRLGLLAVLLLGYADIFGLAASITAGHLALIFFLPFWLNGYLARESLRIDVGTELSILVVLIAAGSLVFLSIVSATYSPAPMRVGRSAIAMLAGLAMFFFIFGTFTRRRAITTLELLVVVIASVCVLTLIGWVSPQIHSIVYELDQDRARGTFKNQNQFGIVLSCVMPVAAAFIYVHKGYRRAISIVMLILLCAGLALTGSKTNLVIAAFGLTIFFFVVAANTPSPQKRIMRFIAVFVIIVVCFFVVGVTLYYLNPRTLVLAVEYWNDGADARTIVSRKEVWEASFAIFANNPFFGGGAEPAFVPEFPEISHSHNALVEYARLLGAAGLVFMFAIHVCVVFLCADTFFRCIFGAGKNNDKAVALGLAIGSMSFLLANQMSDSFGATTAPFFWLLFFTMAYYRTVVFPAPIGVTRHRLRRAGGLGA